ncbi:44185_t:CDS:2 [Gigaspora margarita]|uniref:44185_t:CDS:1 n=1 Tax=Gigaspora margarita TaxID=4874 RepID=A0ABN7UY87_GIGMA|nr:44185_t:CDS:2 [Gigaspora margarita]
MKQQIDNQMQQAILIQTINLDANISQTNSEINENIDIDDFEIVEEVTKSIGKAAYRISGDRHNVGKKINHVMITFALLNDLSTIYYPEKHYTLLIYPGIEKYETLKTILAPLIQELDEIKSGNPNHPQTFVRGLYRPNDITPYIYTLVYHIPEFLNLHSNFGLIGFSCSAVEKKNHQHVVHFFQKTLKDSGGENINKSAIIEIME